LEPEVEPEAKPQAPPPVPPPSGEVTNRLAFIAVTAAAIFFFVAGFLLLATR
jgi:ABC-type cobalt transport system substrate-binding protein